MSPSSPESTPEPRADAARSWDQRFAEFAYRWRFALALLTLAIVGGAFGTGVGRVGAFSTSLATLGDHTSGSGGTPPLLFDPRLDVWFGAHDEAVGTYYEIEDRFVAEDYVMVTYEVPDHPLGVFSPDSLATIARLTERFLTVPGVRHVRSLTYNPWIRWGAIEDGASSEEGLIISDLVEGDPLTLSEDEVIERMVAVLGAERVAARVGEGRVRAVLGADVDFADFIGEPLLLDTIVDGKGETTAIQVQVLRPRTSPELLAETFGDDEAAVATAPGLYSSSVQRASLRGIEHFLRLEAGLAVPTEHFAGLAAWVDGMPEGEVRDEKQLELLDPTRNFMIDADGELVRKYHEWAPDGDGGYVDNSDPLAAVSAPAEFRPEPRVPYAFHVGGIPLFERNFEETGMADAGFLPLMFLVITVGLLLVFRNFFGVITPLIVVFGSVLLMVGVAFARGELFNNLTIMSPNMLTAVGIADAVHLVAAWAMMRSRYDDKRELIVEVMRKNALPVLLTSVTTAVGFYSLMVSDLEPVVMLGFAAGLGTLAAYVLSMSVVPALLSLAPHKKRAKVQKASLAGMFTEERSQRFVAWILRRRFPIVVSALAVVLVAILGVTRVEIDTDFRGMFPSSNPTMADFTWIEQRLGGVGDLEIVFSGAAVSGTARPLDAAEEARLEDLRLVRQANRDGIEEFAVLSSEEQQELAQLESAEFAWSAARIGVSPAFLGELAAFEARLREEMADADSPLHVVTDLTSPLDVLRKMNQVQNENVASFYRVPAEADVPESLRRPELVLDEWTEEWSLTPAQSGSSLVAQYYLQYENGARPGENLSTQLSADRTQVRMQGRVLQAPSSTHRAAFGMIEEIAETEFPALAAQVRRGESEIDGEALSALTVSGKSLLFARTTHLFSTGFVKSMGIALLAITAIIGFIFRSVRLALVSLLPNVLPIVVPLSAFGLLGYPLHGPAILVSSIALGVCVDDTIHFLTKYVRAQRAGKSTEESLAYTLQESGAAITITTVVLIVGFSTMLLSEFTPNFMMGALATLMIGLAWLADFLVTPAVLSYTHPSPATAGASSGARTSSPVGEEEPELAVAS